MKRFWDIVLGVGVAGIAAAVVMLVLPRPPVPAAIKQQVTSTLLLPQTPDAQVDRSSVKFDDKLKLLSMTLTGYGTKVVLSEQPAPDSFSDVPQVYDKVVEQMQEYQKFDVDVGTVHLTRPPQLSGKQAAVLNTKGTLIFVKPDGDLSVDNWRKFFSSLSVVK